MKLRRSLDSMRNLQDNLMRKEERKIKRSLEKLVEFSPASIHKTLHKRPASVGSVKQSEEQQNGTAAVSAIFQGSQFGDHLPKFSSFLRQPTKAISIGEKNTKSSIPFSRLDQSISSVSQSTRFSEDQKWNVTNIQESPTFFRHGFLSRHLSDSSNSSSSHETLSTLPSLPKLLSTAGEKLSHSATQLQDTHWGFSTLEKKLKEMLTKAQANEKSLPQLRPEETLRCRYLRLSNNNISTLLQLCKEAGIQVGIHPHMKESEINISTVFSNLASDEDIYL
nr:PREDICTED: uncharacterized protein C16orf78 homolog isoform X2 [Latimeria chalumnae]|eukprot:XP_014344070.1 PREDICTED: uncharacterized protein C16orf78 homolog isoform X2 [Latimeria chalumnae]